jgi:hypothetical protein
MQRYASLSIYEYFFEFQINRYIKNEQVNYNKPSTVALN